MRIKCIISKCAFMHLGFVVTLKNITDMKTEIILD